MELRTRFRQLLRSATRRRALALSARFLSALTTESIFGARSVRLRAKGLTAREQLCAPPLRAQECGGRRL